MAASCGLGRRQRAMADGGRCVVAAACAKRLGSAAGALAGFVEGPSYLVNAGAALGIGLAAAAWQSARVATAAAAVWASSGSSR